MRNSAKPSWFARLRRDQRLFAALALFLLFAHALQPLASAQAATNGHLVICSAIGAEPLPDGTPVHHDGCGECLVGACGLKTLAKALAIALPAWEPVLVVAEAPLPSRDTISPRSLPPERPPGIRAPPSFT
jgi:hypothetical protein